MQRPSNEGVYLLVRSPYCQTEPRSRSRVSALPMNEAAAHVEPDGLSRPRRTLGPRSKPVLLFGRVAAVTEGCHPPERAQPGPLAPAILGAPTLECALALKGPGDHGEQQVDPDHPNEESLHTRSVLRPPSPELSGDSRAKCLQRVESQRSLSAHARRGSSSVLGGQRKSCKEGRAWGIPQLPISASTPQPADPHRHALDPGGYRRARARRAHRTRRRNRPGHHRSP